MSPELNPWFALTILGDPRLWAGLCVILFFVRVYYKKKTSPYNKKFLWVSAFIIFAGFAMASGLLVSEGLKEIFQVPRICSIETNPYCLSNYSFPSGHTTVAFIAFSGVYFILNRKEYLWVFILPVLVGVSRLALGVHTILDVAAGGSLGILVFFVFYWASKKTEFVGRWTKR